MSADAIHHKEIGLCSKLVSDGDSRWPRFSHCKQVATGQLATGKPACRFHLAMEARATKRQAAREADYAASEAQGVAVQTLIDQLAERGLKATAHYSQRGLGYTGKIIVDPVALLALLKGVTP